MRTLLVLAVLALASPARADSDSDSLWNAEVRLGYGIAVASGDGMTAPRSAPLTLEGDFAIALQDDPRIDGYGGFIVETLDRSSLGVVGGVVLPAGALRLRLGGSHMVAPFTLWGATASGGGCRRMSPGLRTCVDLAVTEYFGGTDIVKGRAETQVQLVFGVVFDAQ